MTETFHLRLPYIAAAQAQKHVTHNEALRALDAIVMLAVDDRDLSSPPPTPAEGARYLVKAPGADGFAGRDGQIAQYRDGAFEFHLPHAGWIAYVADEDALLVHDGDAWRGLFGDLQDVARIGLATVADATNPFAARLNNALFTARAVADGGDGDLRCKLNKESAGNTASLLYQAGYSGRAEIGLAGDDDLHLKVSDDGATWREGIVIAAASGKVTFPHGTPGLREKLLADRTYYVRTDGSDANDGLANSAGGAFLTLQKAADVAFGTLDLGGFNVTVQVADGTYGAGLYVVGAQVGAGRIVFAGNAATPGNVVVANTSNLYTFIAEAGAFFSVKDMQVSSALRGCLLASRGGVIYFANLRIGAAAQHQIRAEDQGRIFAEGNYAVVASAGQSHWNTVGGGVIRVQGRTVTLTGTPNFPNGFAWATTCSAQFVNNNTFAGAGTGPCYFAETNSTILAGGVASYLPGNAAGTTASDGQYA